MQDHLSLGSIYDEIPYIFQADARTYPGKTGALGLLYGLGVEALANARILELGCAQGANILPIAERFKGSYCVGVDLSREHIASGKTILQGLGLKNIELICGDFQALDLPLHSFDYIIAHGLFSWIPEHLQIPLLQTLKGYLAPKGLAHLSFNVLPAWSLRLGLKHYLADLTEGLGSYTAKVDKAHAFLQDLQKTPPLQGLRWKHFLGEDLGLILRQSKHYLAHDFLEPENHPISYKDFYTLAKAQGLQILGESQLRRNILHQLHPEVQGFYRSHGSSELEWNSLYDFLNFRTFRNMLLCHENVELSPEPLPSSFAKLYFSSPLRPETPLKNLDGETVLKYIGRGELLAKNPLDKALLLALAEAYPNALSLEELLENTIHHLSHHGHSFEPKAIMDITGFLFYGYTKNQIDFWTHPIRADKPSDKPSALCPFAHSLNRYLAKNTQYPLINEHYEMIHLSSGQKAVLQLLDGKHSLADITKHLKEKPTVILGALEALAQHVLLRHN